MHRTKRLLLIGGFALAVVAAVLVLTSALEGRSGAPTAEALTPPVDIAYLCAEHETGTINEGAVTLENKTEVGSHNVTAGLNSLYCDFVGKDEAQVAGLDLVCFDIAAPGHDPVAAYQVKTQFDKFTDVTLDNSKELCKETVKTGTPEPTELIYECYAINGFLSTNTVAINSAQFGLAGVEVDTTHAQRLCVPTNQTGKVLDGSAPALVCYNIVHIPVTGTIAVNTNSGSDSVTVTDAVQLCVDADQQEKPDNGGNLSGVAVVQVHGGCAPGTALGACVPVFFYCRNLTDHDSTTDEVKTSAVCFIDVAGQGDPNSGIPNDPNVDLFGPPPPPPYGSGGPFKGGGLYCAAGGCPHPVSGLGGAAPTGTPHIGGAKGPPYPATMAADQLVAVSCVPSIGGALGPNVINVIVINNAKATLPNQTGFVDLYYAQGNDDCSNLTPVGSPTATFPINIDTYDTAPFTVDSDLDGCADGDELSKKRPVKNCGDDPWNPHDSDLDFNGVFTITVEVVRADVCKGGLPAGLPPIGCDSPAQDGDQVAGSYFSCQAVLTHNLTSNDITGAAFCYTDNALLTVNFEDSGSLITCTPFGPAPQSACGDGLSGSAPPAPFGDNDGDLNPITGTFDDVNNRLLIDACFAASNPLQGPFTYARIDANAHTGIGIVDIWLNRTDCDKPTTEPDTKGAGVALAEQDADYDVDQDGCTVTQELGTNRGVGGQRDPFNKYDHMDMNKDGFIDIPTDILGIAGIFGPVAPINQPAQGDVGPTMTGSVAWAHRGFDNVITIPDDILGMAGQFGNNCL